MNNSNNTYEMLEAVSQILIRCFAMGVLVLFIWWGMIWLMGDLAYSIHSKIVPITKQQFDVIHYTGMLMTKATIFVFFLFPYIAIRLVGKNRMAGNE